MKSACQLLGLLLQEKGQLELFNIQSHKKLLLVMVGIGIGSLRPRGNDQRGVKQVSSLSVMILARAGGFDPCSN